MNGFLHFRNYLDNVERELIEPGDRSWKEIDECYLPPNPDLDGIKTMSPSEYVEKVIAVSNHVLTETDSQITCVQSDVVPRPNTSELFQRHFGLQMKGVSDSEILFNQVPSKMELVFKKISK